MDMKQMEEVVEELAMAAFLAARKAGLADGVAYEVKDAVTKKAEELFAPRE